MSAYSIASRGLPQGTLTPVAELLFSQAEQGLVYDIDNISTLYQDSAFTAPVTAVEQPVGGILDLSGRGNHASMVTTPKRPIYSRRVNLIGNPMTVVGGTVENLVGYFGDSDGIRAVRTSISDDMYYPLPTDIGNKTLVISVLSDSEARPGNVLASLYTTNGSITLNFTSSGSVSISSATNGFVGLSASSVPKGGTKYLLTYSVSIPNISPAFARLYMSIPTLGGGKIIGKPSITLATDAHLPYQRVNTNTDYDADPAKFPAYLRFDGVDDALQTGSIDFTGTDKMTVWAGVTKLSDAGAGQIVQCGVNNSQPGFILGGPSSSPNPNFLSRSRGSVASSGAYTPNTYPAPISASLTVQCSVPDKVNTLRVNGASYFDGTDQGSGKYANIPIYIGSSLGAASFLNGRLYSLIVRGAQSSLSQIEATEAYIKQKMRLP